MADLQEEVRYYRRQSSTATAEGMVAASRKVLDQIERNPGIGSSRIGESLSIPKLKNWRFTGFPLVWFYFERDDFVDVARLLGERQDILSILK